MIKPLSQEAAKSLAQDKDLAPKLSYSTLGRRSKAAGQTRDEYAEAHGYQKQGKGNKAVWVRVDN